MSQNVVVSFIAMISLGLLAVVAWGGIEGSKHDFTREQWSSGDACAACHTPHREKPPEAAPRWDPGADLSRRFGDPVASPAELGLGTTMCLRCHDGTIARDNIGGVAESRHKNTQHPAFSTASHGKTDHPVGVRYPESDKGYHPLTSVLARGAFSIPNGIIQCSSCHDPHDAANQKYMLVVGNDGSQLCLTCHNK